MSTRSKKTWRQTLCWWEVVYFVPWSLSLLILFSRVYNHFQTFQCYSHQTGFQPYKALLRSRLNINITGLKVFGPFGTGGRARQMIVQVVFLIGPWGWFTMDEFRSNPMSTHEGLRSTSHSLRVFHYLERGLPLRVRSTQIILLMILYHGDNPLIVLALE